MKKFIVFGFLATLICAFAWVSAANDAVPAAYSTEISVAPAGEGAYLVRAIVKDGGSGEALAGPSLKMRPGKPAEADSSLPDGGTVNFTASVDEGKHSATYSVVVKKGDRVLAQHSARIAL